MQDPVQLSQDHPSRCQTYLSYLSCKEREILLYSPAHNFIRQTIKGCVQQAEPQNPELLIYFINAAKSLAIRSPLVSL